MGESSQRNDKSRGLLADFGWESQEGYNKRTREYQHECMEIRRQQREKDQACFDQQPMHLQLHAQKLFRDSTGGHRAQLVVAEALELRKWDRDRETECREVTDSPCSLTSCQKRQRSPAGGPGREQGVL